MKDYLLKNKWFGSLALLLCALITAFYFTHTVMPVIDRYAPILAQEADNFLPITFENSEIVAPKDTIISKTYGDANSKFEIVLDTRKDAFDTSALSTPGMYVSKKYIYVVNEQKTEVRSFASMKLPNMVLDKEVVQTWSDYAQKKLGKYLFVTTFLLMLLYVFSAVVLYTAVMHWLIAKFFNVRFSQTFMLNAFTYTAIALIGLFTGFNLSVLVTLVALVAVNVAVNAAWKENVA